MVQGTDWRAPLAALLVAALLAPAAAAGPKARLAILDFGFLDTSGEPGDQTAAHAARLQAMAEGLRTTLAASDRFEVVTLPKTGEPCPESDSECLLERARAAGAELVLAGAVHKTSSMLLSAWAGGFETATGKRVFYRHLSFRGDNDKSWRRATRFLAREIEDEMRR